ncbi:hypothetical protein ETAE_2305 [Edwardsiella piscicida]|uniref:Uncharacterized protein n=1 Tax=Edwardsiella piscicida TaxID=1263550 RepID=A0AAU8PKF6_EDWPI|nr:hypothetical protein ETAE_2305 [Edwardsiella tarda EIB202]
MVREKIILLILLYFCSAGRVHWSGAVLTAPQRRYAGVAQ